MAQLDPAFHTLFSGKRNFVFLGEAGAGKSEIALNLAHNLQEKGDAPVDFFDMDQTKPLFRSRDAGEVLAQSGVRVHFEEQHYDAPTLVGGVAESLKDKGAYTILDVGGNDTGARLIGGFSQYLKGANTLVVYVVNPYRPWAKDVVNIDCTMSAILRACRLKEIVVLGNPSLGADTTPVEFLEGCRMLQDMLGPYIPIHGVAVEEGLLPAVQGKTKFPLLPIKLYLTYPWLVP